MLATATMQPSVLTVNGTPVTFYDSRDAKGRSDVLLLIHGTAGSTATHFGFLFPILAAKQRVIAVDLSRPNIDGAALQMEDLVAQVASTIEEVLPRRKVVLLGYSLGAVVSAVLAARHPDLVARLILISGWIKTDLQQLLRNDIWLALRKSGSDALREYTTFCAFGGPYLATKSRVDVQPGMDQTVFDEFGDLQMDLNRRIDIVEDAHLISAPTLVIGCTHDQMAPIRHQKDLFGAIADARFAEIPSGHAVVIERPSELCHHVQRFLDDPSEHDAGTIIGIPKP